MMIRLGADQRREMSERSRDVSTLVEILHASGQPEASREAAFLAWSEHSDRSAASWLIIPKDPEGFHEVSSAYNSLVHSRAGVPAGIDPRQAPEFTTRDTVPSASNKAHDEALMRLEKIGFSPDSTRSRTNDAVTRMEHIAGRLSNVRYMANAIDAADGIAPERRARTIPGGQRQFDFMMNDSQRGLRDAGRAYVALRRAQRAGDEQALRTGLVLMVAADNGEIGHKDVLAALGDDGIPKTMAVETKKNLSTGTKGPADSTQALSTVLANGKAGTGR